MELDQESIKKFKDAYLKVYGETITDNEASEMLSRLVNILKTVIYGGVGEAQSSSTSKVDKSK
jgi:hypothetical protein